MNKVKFIEKQIRKGINVRVIAKELGVSFQSVYNFIKTNNIPLDEIREEERNARKLVVLRKKIEQYRKKRLEISKRKPLRRVWNNIKQRCGWQKHPEFHRYGGRSISMCSEWVNDSRAFIEWSLAHGWNNTLEIDRINNDGNYEPSNVRFVSARINCNNRSERIRDSFLPMGVTSSKNGKRYYAYFRGQHLGSFTTVDEALKQRNCIRRIYLASIGAL